MKLFSLNALFALFLFASGFFSLVGCAHSSKIESLKTGTSAEVETRRQFLIGSWFGEAQTTDGMLRKSLMRRRSDGTYTVQFQFYQNNLKKAEQVEAGIWGLSGNLYFTATREFFDGKDFRPLDTTQAKFYDGYQILQLTSDHFKYKSLEGSDVYESKRVPDSFRLQ